MIYLELFWAFFQIGLFSFGGGYASIPLIQTHIVEQHHWLTMQQFTDIVSISQMTPGPIAINSATFVGIQVSGSLGALVATVGCILPSCIIVLILALLYQKYAEHRLLQGILAGFRPAVVGMIAAATWSILILAFQTDFSWLPFYGFDLAAILLFAVCLFLLRKVKLSAAKIMMAAGGVGLIAGVVEQLING